MARRYVPEAGEVVWLGYTSIRKPVMSRPAGGPRLS